MLKWFGHVMRMNKKEDQGNFLRQDKKRTLGDRFFKLFLDRIAMLVEKLGK